MESWWLDLVWDGAVLLPLSRLNQVPPMNATWYSFETRNCFEDVISLTRENALSAKIVASVQHVMWNMNIFLGPWMI